MNKRIEELSKNIDWLLIIRKVETILEQIKQIKEGDDCAYIRIEIQSVIKDMLDYEEAWGDLNNAEEVWNKMREVLEELDKY